MPRVAVTGMAGLTPVGSDWATVDEALRDGRTGIVRKIGRAHV